MVSSKDIYMQSFDIFRCFFFSETLRKHSPIGGLQRVVTEAYQLPDHDVVLEKGTDIFIPTQSIHYDPEFYPSPEVFDPERFTDEAIAARPDFTFLPFGDGPKICIGK